MIVRAKQSPVPKFFQQSHFIWSRKVIAGHHDLWHHIFISAVFCGSAYHASNIFKKGDAMSGFATISDKLQGYALLCVGLATVLIVTSGHVYTQPVMQDTTEVAFKAEDFNIQTAVTEVTDAAFVPVPQQLVEPAAGTPNTPKIFLYETQTDQK